MKDVLKLNIYKKHSLKYLNINKKVEKEIIDKINELGYIFEDEKEEVFHFEDDIDKLNLFKVLMISLHNYGVYTIEGLLELSISKKDSIKKRFIYNVRGFGEKKIQELIHFMHLNWF